MGLIQDAIVLAQAGYSTTSSALDILLPLSGECNYLVWSEITSALDSVSAILWEQDQQVIDAFSKFQRQLVSSLAQEIGFDTLPTDDQDRIQLRVKILGAAARAEDPKRVNRDLISSLSMYTPREPITEVV
jgi:aminopeptidase 2